jgi:hypothetical protein
MAELKTQVNDASVIDFINSVEIEQRRMDSLELLRIFAEETGEQPKMWGDSIVGYGKYHYESQRSAQKGDWMMTGFSPRKQNISIYIIPGFTQYDDIMSDLGKFKTSVSCLYVKKLSDIDETKLRKLIKAAFDHMKSKYPG